MAANDKTQMVLSHDDGIIVSNGLQHPVTSARQPSVKFIHPNIVKVCIKSPKYYVMLVTILVNSSYLSTEFRVCRHIRVHYMLVL